ncbi:hypothetical protein ACQ4PT_047338 [Festuca glaucescens]
MAVGGRRAAMAACGRWCLVILAVASALGVSGPALYWRYKKGFSSSAATAAAAAVSSPTCPPCTCDCPPPLSLQSIAPVSLHSRPSPQICTDAYVFHKVFGAHELLNFRFELLLRTRFNSACGTNDPERNKEMEKQFVDLLNEELKLQQVVAEEHIHHMNATLVEAKRQATQYQREAEKCNVATETCEEAREKSEGAISKEKKLTALWERRARELGWQDSRAATL